MLCCLGVFTRIVSLVSLTPTATRFSWCEANALMIYRYFCKSLYYQLWMELHQLCSKCLQVLAGGDSSGCLSTIHLLVMLFVLSDFNISYFGACNAFVRYLKGTTVSRYTNKCHKNNIHGRVMENLQPMVIGHSSLARSENRQKGRRQGKLKKGYYMAYLWRRSWSSTNRITSSSDKIFLCNRFWTWSRFPEPHASQNSSQKNRNTDYRF